MEKFKTKNVHKTGPTAWAVAYKRTLADISYAKEIFHELTSAIETANETEKDYFEKAKDSKNTPQLEARYKMIDLILKEQSPKQILEIASGLASRGMSMTEKDSDLVYVELDLPGVMSEKQKIVEKLKNKLDINLKKLYLEVGDALDYESLLAATKHFEQEEIAVVNEGLLRYLTFKQKAQVAQNVHKILEKVGGVWITPDITMRKIILTENKGKEYDRISKLAGIDINANSFRDKEHAKEFFENQGFLVDIRSLTEVEDLLVSPEKIGMSLDEVHETIKNVVVFIMKIAN